MIAPADGPWVDQWLSPARLARYLTAASADRSEALALYEWNAQVSAALQRDLGHLEIALRNAYDTAATSGRPGQGHWLRDDYNVLFAALWRSKTSRSGVRRPVDVNEKPRRQIAQALQAAGAGSQPGKVVAELAFGFWRYLSTSAHEKTLWVPFLHAAFPPGTSRQAVDAAAGRLHELRNRVAHHEPLLREDLQARHYDLIKVAGWLHPELAGHLSATTTVPALLQQRP